MANENLKKQMVIKLGTTTNEDAQIISNMVDNAAGGGGGGYVFSKPFITNQTITIGESIVANVVTGWDSTKIQNDAKQFVAVIDGVANFGKASIDRGVLILNVYLLDGDYMAITYTANAEQAYIETAYEEPFTLEVSFY